MSQTTARNLLHASFMSVDKRHGNNEATNINKWMCSTCRPKCRRCWYMSAPVPVPISKRLHVCLCAIRLQLGLTEERILSHASSVIRQESCQLMKSHYIVTSSTDLRTRHMLTCGILSQISVHGINTNFWHQRFCFLYELLQPPRNWLAIKCERGCHMALPCNGPLCWAIGDLDILSRFLLSAIKRRKDHAICLTFGSRWHQFETTGSHHRISCWNVVDCDSKPLVMEGRISNSDSCL